MQKHSQDSEQEQGKMTLAKGSQILRSRDDPFPFHLEFVKSSEGPLFRFSSGSTPPWSNAGDDVGPRKLRGRIEPWLTALVQSEHLSLLIGSGLTHAVHGMATHRPAPGMDITEFSIFDKEISAELKRIARTSGRSNGNFEDQIGVAFDLLRGLEILTSTKAETDPAHGAIGKLRSEVAEALSSFASSILAGESNLASAPEDTRDLAFNYLVSFLMSFASRTGTRERLHIFTTNYDRYIEAGADLAGLRLIDRFIGSLTPVFRSSRLDVDMHYNPPGIRGEPRYLEGVARFTKLHGSVDWVDYGDTIRRVGLPFGSKDAETYFDASGYGNIGALQLMVYPNSAKDRETASYPYVELFRDFAAAVCRPNSTLVCYGYSFGDEHINRVIEDMLIIPSTHLVVISYGDPLDRIMQTYEKLGRHAQVTLMIGDHLGDLRTLSDHYLPKPAIDRTTMRMADLLRARLDPGSGTDSSGNAPPEGQKGSES